MPYRIVEIRKPFEPNNVVRDVERDSQGLHIEYTEEQLQQFEIERLTKEVNTKVAELQSAESRLKSVDGGRVTSVLTPLELLSSLPGTDDPFN